MSGEKDLRKLISNMNPTLNAGIFVFCTVEEAGKFLRYAIGSFREQEGTTLIVRKDHAIELGLEYSNEMCWITLNIHSALDAYGFTAAFSNALAEAEISCNVIAAYYHDHIFVGKSDAERAMQILKRLSKGANSS